MRRVSSYSFSERRAALRGGWLVTPQPEGSRQYLTLKDARSNDAAAGGNSHRTSTSHGRRRPPGLSAKPAGAVALPVFAVSCWRALREAGPRCAGSRQYTAAPAVTWVSPLVTKATRLTRQQTDRLGVADRAADPAVDRPFARCAAAQHKSHQRSSASTCVRLIHCAEFPLTHARIRGPLTHARIRGRRGTSSPGQAPVPPGNPSAYPRACCQRCCP